VAAINDNTYTNGLAGLGSTYSPVMFDNLIIE